MGEDVIADKRIVVRCEGIRSECATVKITTDRHRLLPSDPGYTDQRQHRGGSGGYVDLGIRSLRYLPGDSWNAQFSGPGNWSADAAASYDTWSMHYEQHRPGSGTLLLGRDDGTRCRQKWHRRSILAKCSLLRPIRFLCVAFRSKSAFMNRTVGRFVRLPLCRIFFRNTCGPLCAAEWSRLYELCGTHVIRLRGPWEFTPLERFDSDCLASPARQSDHALRLVAVAGE